jgi:hypothetical protein
MSTKQPRLKFEDGGSVAGPTIEHLVSPGRDGLRQHARKTNFEEELQPEHVEGYGPHRPIDVNAMVAKLETTTHEVIAVIFDDRGAHLESNLEEFKKIIESRQKKHGRYKTPERWVAVKNPVRYETASLPLFYSDPLKAYMAKGEQEKQEFMGVMLEAATTTKTLFELFTRGSAGRGLMVVACVIHLFQGVIHIHFFYVIIDEHGFRLGHQSPKLKGGGNHTVIYKIGLASIAARRYRSLGVAPIPQLLPTPNGKSRLVTGWDLLDGKLNRAKELGYPHWDVALNDGLDRLVEDFASKRPSLATAINESKAAAVMRHNQRAQERRQQLGLDAKEKLTALEAEHKSALHREKQHFTEIDRLKMEKAAAADEKEAAEKKLKEETARRKHTEALLKNAQNAKLKLLTVIQILTAGITGPLQEFGAYISSKFGCKKMTLNEANVAACEIMVEIKGQNKKSEISDKEENYEK